MGGGPVARRRSLGDAGGGFCWRGLGRLGLAARPWLAWGFGHNERFLSSPGGRLSPVLVIIGQYLSAKPTTLFGQKDVSHDLCRTRRTRRREDRISRAPRPCRALRFRLGCLW